MKSTIDSLMFRLLHPGVTVVDKVVYNIPEEAILNPEVKFLDAACQKDNIALPTFDVDLHLKSQKHCLL